VKHVFLSLVLLTFGILPAQADAAGPITFRYKHFLYTLNPASFPAWNSQVETWTYNGKRIEPPASLLVDGDVLPALPPGMQKGFQRGWNKDAIRQTLRERIASDLDRPAGAVTIKKNASGAVVFDGVGMTGREVDLDRSADLTVAALEADVTDVTLVVHERQPAVTVEDPELVKQGVKEVVTVGESDFSNSPANRRHNIAVGLAKFNGYLIKKGETFSFDEVLGPVDASTGYKKELVIKGPVTIPDYGGGLCQVSSTAYRGVWEYGFPIVARRNHSYVVNHYAPYGTDATVYPPTVDMKFTNDSPGALLIQTYAKDDLAYFIYYGTKDDRRTSVLGPFIWDRVAAPPDKTQLTLDLAPGERKKVGERVPGLKAAWGRAITTATGAHLSETFTSVYEARPLYYLVGTAELPAAGTGGALTTAPVFLED